MSNNSSVEFTARSSTSEQASFGKPILKVTETFTNKVNLYLESISHTEWSGMLYYTYTGDASKPDKMVFTLVDIILLDIGTTVYTEYSVTGQSKHVMDYINLNPHLMDCKMGHIHSHHSMDTYPSGVDMKQVSDGILKGQFDLLLSVIVNNKREMTAIVGFKVVTTVTGTANSNLVFKTMRKMFSKPYETTIVSCIHQFCIVPEPSLLTPTNLSQICVTKQLSFLLRPSTVFRQTSYTPSTRYSRDGNKDLMEEYDNMFTYRNQQLPAKPIEVASREENGDDSKPVFVFDEDDVAAVFLEMLKEEWDTHNNAIRLFRHLKGMSDSKFKDWVDTCCDDVNVFASICVVFPELRTETPFTVLCDFSEFAVEMLSMWAERYGIALSRRLVEISEKIDELWLQLN